MSEFIEARIADYLDREGAETPRLPAVSQIAKPAQRPAALRVTDGAERRPEPRPVAVAPRVTEAPKPVIAQPRPVVAQPVRPAATAPVRPPVPQVDAPRPIATAPVRPPVQPVPQIEAPRPIASAPVRPIAPPPAPAPLPVAPPIRETPRAVEVARPIRVAEPPPAIPRTHGRPAPTPADKVLKVYKREEMDAPVDRTDYRAIRF